MSEQLYNETIDRLFSDVHSQLFAADKKLMQVDTKQKMVSSVAALIQLPEKYVQIR